MTADGYASLGLHPSAEAEVAYRRWIDTAEHARDAVAAMREATVAADEAIAARRIAYRAWQMVTDSTLTDESATPPGLNTGGAASPSEAAPEPTGCLHCGLRVKRDGDYLADSSGFLPRRCYGRTATDMRHEL